MPNVTIHDLATLTDAIIAECEEDANFSDLFVAEIPNLIKRAESRVYGDLQLGLFDRTEVGQLASGTKTQAIRTLAWQQIRSIYLRADDTGTPTGQRFPLLRRSYDFCLEYDGDDPTAVGLPPYFSELNEDEIYVALTPDQDYHFEAHIVANDATQSVVDTDPDPTWLSTNMGDILMFASVIEALRYLQADDTEIQTYEKAYAGRLLVDRNTVRESMRVGEYTPVADSAKTVGDSQ